VRDAREQAAGASIVGDVAKMRLNPGRWQIVLNWNERVERVLVLGRIKTQLVYVHILLAPRSQFLLPRVCGNCSRTDITVSNDQSQPPQHVRREGG
jgi:hypothetical protein